jgi:glutathione synthase/RimK-type ligase-like ATP-grasp enzyme
MTILVLTHRGDAMRDLLAELPAREPGVVLVDTDRFPSAIDLDASFEDGRLEGHLGVDGRRIDLGAISSVWHRREAVGADLPPDLPPDLRAACVDESEAVLIGTLAATDAFHVDPQVVRRLARTKPLQLERARRAGLAVPRTLTSTDPAALRAFAAEHDAVFKMLENYVDPARPGRATVFVNRVRADQIDADATLVPVTLQERLEKALEVRAVVVGRRVYAAAVRSQASPLARDDWRRDGAGLIDAWFPWTLPADVEAALLRLHDALGLTYGASDLVVTPEGRTVFLEVNPMGEFFWLEARLGFPILADLADVLAGRTERRTAPPVNRILR